MSGPEQSPNAPSDDYNRGWDDCLDSVCRVLGEKFPRALTAKYAVFKTSNHRTGSLLKEPGPLPPGCYCKPGRCMAPKPDWCRDETKRDAPAS